MAKRKEYATLKGVASKLLEAVDKMSENLIDIKPKDSVPYLEQLNMLLDKILLMKGMPNQIKKDIKEVVKPKETKTSFNVNDVLDTVKKSKG